MLAAHSPDEPPSTVPEYEAHEQCEPDRASNYADDESRSSVHKATSVAEVRTAACCGGRCIARG